MSEVTKLIYLQDLKSTFDKLEKESQFVLQVDFMKNISREIEKAMKMERRVVELERELNEVETEFKKCVFE